MMIPAGNIAKLIRVTDPADQDFRITEVCDKLKMNQPTPVIILAGAMTERAAKTLAGVARVAFRTDATIIDSGLGTGIEKFCLRKNVKLMGVAPEHEIIYPRINPDVKKDNELTNGHTHFILLGDNKDSDVKPAKSKTLAKKAGKKLAWGEEAQVKFDLAKRLAAGRNKIGGSTNCKIVTVLIGDNPQCYQDV